MNNVAFDLLLVLIAFLSVSPEFYSLLRRKQVKTIVCQLLITAAAAVAGIFAVNRTFGSSIAEALNSLVPW